jgi:triacylglycerol lipase
MTKILPPATFKEIRPPNENYTYFEGWDTKPFLPQTVNYELVNAAWLADFAMLAYGSEALIRRVLDQSGLTAAGFVMKFFSAVNTQCFVAHNDEFVVLSMRGTEADNFRGAIVDWAADFDMTQQPDESGGRVHEGFRKGIDVAWPEIKAYLQPLLQGEPGRALWITGHSLGAALATLAAERAARDGQFEVHGVYPFGSPRVGDAQFKQSYASRGLDARTFRFVNNLDVVCKIPPGKEYSHVGQVKFIDQNGHLHDEMPVDDSSVEAQLARLGHDTVALSKDLFGLTIPAPFANHAPIYYASHIWNNL